MKRVVLFYFSGTGNTWWVSECICKHLAERGFSAAAHSIEGLQAAETAALLEECDIAGFGYPVYGSDVPVPMKDFLEGLPQGGDKPAFVFCTQWLWSGDGARVGAVFLRQRGYTLRWAEHFLMPNNISLTVTKLVPYTNDAVKIGRVKARAAKRVGVFTKRIDQDQPYTRGFGAFAEFFGSWQRIPFQKTFTRWQNDIGFVMSLCTQCGRCVRLCPVQNIAWKDGRYEAKGRCILCMRCYNFCPVSAITYMGRSHNRREGKPYQGPGDGFKPERLVGWTDHRDP